MYQHQDMTFRLAQARVESGQYSKIPNSQFKKIHNMYKRMVKDLELCKGMGADFKNAHTRVFTVLLALDREERMRTPL